jgi:hypothetical protein
MATSNAINANTAGLVRYNGTGTFDAVTTTNHYALVGASSNGITNVLMTAGQVLIGTTASDPAAATLTAGSGISISSVSGAITISALSGGFTWNDVTGTSAAMAIANGYLADNAGLVTLTLPATAVQFSEIQVKGYGAGGWRIAQNANQQIRFGSATATTVGVGGSLASTNLNDGVRLIATVGGASTIWTVLSAIGNITIV